jgi:SprB repeat
MACTTCIRWMVWNESESPQIFYSYSCNDGTTSQSATIQPGNFYSVCGCQESGSYATSQDVYIENGGSGFINFNGILLNPCVDEPEPSITPTPFPTRTPNYTPTPTSIVCGSGYTTSEKCYYYDCCGNYVYGTSSGTTIIFDYTKPHNGVTKLFVPASTTCPTPTPTATPNSTPTATVTPTVTSTVTSSPTNTPTPTPTPTNNVIYVPKNDCDVFTVFPMGVSCYGVNPSTPKSFDGKLYLTITGGTPPYDITWEGGQKTPYLFNLKGGSYQVVVSDFYGDFTAYTSCSLIAPSPTPTNTPTPSITPSATPVYPNLCMFIQWGQDTPEQIQFFPNGSINGKPSWSNGSTYGMVWNPQNSTWYVTGYTQYGGTVASQDASVVPLSGWYPVGATKNANVTVYTGTCSTINVISAKVTAQASSCLSSCDGAITILPSGGIGPYLYSTDNGVTFNGTNVINGLCPGAYSVVVKDQNNAQYQQTVVVASQASPVTYSVGIQQLTQATSATFNRSITWRVVVQPPLPAGVTLSFDLGIDVEQVEKQPGEGSATYTLTTKKNTNILTPTTTGSSSIDPRPFCAPNNQYTTDYVNTYPITMVANDVVSGTCVSNVNITTPVNLNGCMTQMIQDIDVYISNVSINGCNCCSAIYNQGTAVLRHTLNASQITVQ